MKKGLLPVNRDLPVFPYYGVDCLWFFYIFQETEMLEPVVFHETGFFKNLFFIKHTLLPIE
jgi:hypothetical protein